MNLEDKEKELDAYFDEINRLNKKELKEDTNKKYYQITGTDKTEIYIRDIATVIDQLFKITIGCVGIDSDDSIDYIKNNLYEYSNENLIPVDIYTNDAAAMPIATEYDYNKGLFGRIIDEFSVSQYTSQQSALIEENIKGIKTTYNGNMEFDIAAAVRRTLQPVFSSSGIECHPWMTSAQKSIDPIAGSRGICAAAVSRFLDAGKVSTPNDRPYPNWGIKYATTGWLQNHGFEMITSTPLTSHQECDDWTSSDAKVGDIAVIPHETYGHICMYCGNAPQWVSDFTQNHMSPYSICGNCYVFRFKGVK